MRTETPLPKVGQTDTRFPASRIRTDHGDHLPASVPYIVRFERVMERAFLLAFAEGGSRS